MAESFTKQTKNGVNDESQTLPIEFEFSHLIS